MTPVCAVLLASIGLSLAGPCVATPADEPAYSANLDDSAWKRLIEQQAARQQAGETHPEGRDISWQQYWNAWYQSIRDSSALPWPHSEFKSKQEMIGYIRTRLKAHGLPAYENT